MKCFHHKTILKGFFIVFQVVTIGFICGIMFIFFQLKLYISILLRWKQYNQIVIIENVSNEVFKSKSDKNLSSTIDMTFGQNK